ncbi:L-ornithine 5-monooxygenase (L-ornithine N(5)-oxygenase) [Mytilinidion resinicola]|uniref:L-ornithine N(5)-monooxygenase [NAD(P)H] n=1 Tax=Mytilinidion resinicola TaxID=574789 RepID=A0A6A6YYY9_9PEZI|nr:L-ornithine 5-monooxygenase (L-ornithine N(5)-oxygenase) [Mytilinidion resinicola]KAF2813970.1 L-ornithine 5-monooxygenase (L-ornithine N(5)-oxygenase) [Mytilinidion resinicola]
MTPHADSPTRPLNGLFAGCDLDRDEHRTSGFDTMHQNFPENSSLLSHTCPDELHDLVCVGFGPASLAIAVALHDALDGFSPASDLSALQGRAPKVCFLERQAQFAWHAGMLLPGAKMQISFIKDMATLRNPRSEFTFINYLHRSNRLVEFTNLNTFLPQRIEYEDYMRWCAGWFEDVVEYSQDVVQIVPEKSSESHGQTKAFVVTSKNSLTSEISTRRTKHVVIAAGGRPSIPAPFPEHHSKVIHSSKFSYLAPKILRDPAYPYKIAVVGSGQSAAEIFDNLHAHYPNAKTTLLIKSGALRPSDDSPFVNEIFNPDRVSPTYAQNPLLRAATILEDRGTNYGVVRLDLLERIYETLYTQRIRYGNDAAAEAEWPHRILPHRIVSAVEESSAIPGGVRLTIRNSSPQFYSGALPGQDFEEVMDVDAVFVATGYKRNAHEELLHDARGLRRGGEREDDDWEVARDYRVLFEDGKVSEDAGIWLQGACEKTHGLSDTLLSILANRGGEMVKSIFGTDHGSGEQLFTSGGKSEHARS